MMNDQDKKLTSDEMYKEAQNEYNVKISRPVVDSDNILIKKESNIKILSEVYHKLKEALFCGKGEAAFYLAQFYYNGWLFEKNIIKGDFIIAIGKHCFAPNCTYIPYRSDNPLSEEYKKLAVECAETIQGNNNKFKNNVDQEAKNWAEFNINKTIEKTLIHNIFTPPPNESSKILFGAGQSILNSNEDTLISSNRLDNDKSSSKTLPYIKTDDSNNKLNQPKILVNKKEATTEKNHNSTLHESSQILPNTEELNNYSCDITLTSSLNDTKNQSSSSNLQSDKPDKLNNLNASTNSTISRVETEKTELEPTSGSTISYIISQPIEELTEQEDSVPISGDKKQGCCNIL